MSIVFENPQGWIVDHPEFIKTACSNVSANKDLPFKNFTLNKKLFKIITPFLCDLEAVSVSKTNRKRKQTREFSFVESFEVNTVKSNSEKIILLAKKKGLLILDPCKEDYIANNKEARDLSSSFFNHLCQQPSPQCSGGNTSQSPIIVELQGQDYLIPKSSKFFCCNVNELVKRFQESAKFDFILLDPPWWNKYIRRKKSKQETSGYKMMYNEEVGSLPLSSWLAPGALVAVWCTNCARHIQDVTNKWFPAWGVNHVATWYWMKVTCNGKPVCQFSLPPGKQPYERILFGAAVDRSAINPPDDKCLISVPSAIHSHKPPLSELMERYLPPEPQCLELFARYLLPDWTSAGDQVLTLQNLKLYTEIQESDS